MPPPPEPGSFDPNAPTGQMLQRVMARRYRPSGFDRDMQIGAVLLGIGFFIIPVIFGPVAVYFGYRSHAAGNPMGWAFALAAAALTVAFVLVANLGLV